VELRDRERRDPVPAKWNDPDKAIVFEPAADLADGGAACIVETAKLRLGEGAARRELALDDVLAELAVEGIYDAFHFHSIRESRLSAVLITG
jgi:hypothetical protein